MLYYFDRIDELPDGFPELCAMHLTPQRREKVFSYRFSLDRKLSAAVYLLLRMALEKHHGVCEPVTFSFGKNGKPFLGGYPEIHFNLSHCKRAAACAVSRDEIGVDVQELTPVSDDLARLVLTPKEYAEFKAAENPSLRFCEYWTAKESYLKKRGDGIDGSLASLSADSIGGKTFFSSSGEYIGCVTGECGAVRRVGTPEIMLFLQASSPLVL